ncbi:hypothetical protein HCN51_13315 [Nonomuraea sp. FMUSA5-5]|uniref:Uncharacterized protein n=1 Tax=Nonomuraea composti TaxID=2720023 RepID=A0ABX1B3T3_9ACTN|nr:hypothetical protein [Nonomuraea sp. FMUSA5-5]NJP90421.1 hypothetical protein [Nonomuraea sp. FMUSA5-5]
MKPTHPINAWAGRLVLKDVNVSVIPPSRPPRPPVPAIWWKTYLTIAAICLVVAIYAAILENLKAMTALTTACAGFLVMFIRAYVRRSR